MAVNEEWAFIRQTPLLLSFVTTFLSSQFVENKFLLFVYPPSLDIFLWRQFGTKGETIAEERSLDVNMKSHFSTG